MFGNDKSNKIVTTTHHKPIDYHLPKNIKDDLEDEAAKIEVSETGRFLFAASGDVICIYNSDKV